MEPSNKEEEEVVTPPTLSTLPPELIAMVLARPELSLEDLYGLRLLCSSFSQLASEALVARIKDLFADDSSLYWPDSWAMFASFVANVRKSAKTRADDDNHAWKPLHPKVVGTLLRLAGYQPSPRRIPVWRTFERAFGNEFCLTAVKASVYKALRVPQEELFTVFRESSHDGIKCWAYGSCCAVRLSSPTGHPDRRAHERYERLAFMGRSWEPENLEKSG